MEMVNLLECEWSVNSGVFAPKNRYRASIGDTLSGQCRIVHGGLSRSNMTLSVVRFWFCGWV